MRSRRKELPSSLMYGGRVSRWLDGWSAFIWDSGTEGSNINTSDAVISIERGSHDGDVR